MSKQLTETEIQNIADRIMEKVGDAIPADQRESGMMLKTNFGRVFEHGQIFKAKTMKGDTNYVLFLFQRKDPQGKEWVYWAHGDRSKKTDKQEFIRLIESGDLNPIERKDADPERIAMAVLGLQAMAQGLSFNDYMKVIWNEGEGSQAY